MSSSPQDITTRDEDSVDRKAQASDAYENARERTSAAYGAARERAQNAYENARSSVSRGRERTVEEVDSHPIGAVLGGFALGAVLAAVLPRTERESKAFGEVGHKLTDAARDAARSAADASREQIDEITGQAVTKVGHAVLEAVQSGGKS